MSRLLLVLIGMVLLASSCSKSAIEIQPEPSVARKLAFDVYTVKDYNDAVFDNMLAEVHLNISKQNLKTKTTVTLWDTTYAFRQFKNYPQMAQKYSLEKTVLHLERSEMLHVSTIVRFNYNGYMSMEAKGESAKSDYNHYVVAF